MKKKQLDAIVAEVNEMSFSDIFYAVGDIKSEAIKELLILGGVALALSIIFMKYIVVAIAIFAAFLFIRPFYFKKAHINIYIVEVRSDKTVGQTNQGYVASGFALILFVALIVLYYRICDKIFPAYAVYPVILMVMFVLGMLAKPVAEDIHTIVLANRINKLFLGNGESDTVPMRNAYIKGIREHVTIKRRVWLVALLLIAISVPIAIGRYNLRSSELEKMFNPYESYIAETGDDAGFREVIPQSVLEDMSYGKFQLYSSQYKANYNFSTTFSGFEMKYDISVLYEFGENTTPHWTVEKYKCHSESLGSVNHSGVWTGEGTDDQAPVIFQPECTFTLTFETLTETYAKGSLRLVGTDGTELYSTDFEGGVERNGDLLVALVTRSNPRETFGGLDSDLKITVNPLTEKASLGMDYLSANLSLNRE